MGKRSKRGSDRLSRLLRLRTGLPRLQCKGLCQEACGPVPGTRLEEARLISLTGIQPDVDPETLTCIYLQEGRCSAYDERPMICRLYGMVQGEMECEHGCVPDRWLSDAEGKRLLRDVEAIGGRNDEWVARITQRIRQAQRPRMTHL
jgi:Fe-S-cluster containining protein